MRTVKLPSIRCVAAFAPFGNRCCWLANDEHRHYKAGKTGSYKRISLIPLRLGARIHMAALLTECGLGKSPYPISPAFECTRWSVDDELDVGVRDNGNGQA